MAKYLQVTLVRAIKVSAATLTKAKTRVYAKAYFKNIVYTTSTVKDMGLNPKFYDDGSNVFHFAYENDDEFITFELFNRNDVSIGKSTLTFAKDLEDLEPGKDPKEKTLKVKDARDKQAGDLILKAQLHHHQVKGEKGNLHVRLIEGSLNKITSVMGFGSRTTTVSAKLKYKHTTLTSGILQDMGNNFDWCKDNEFIFLINNDIKPESDVLGISVYNGTCKVGDCMISMQELLAGPGTTYTRNGQELLNKRTVGSINLDTTYILTTPICVTREEPRPRISRTPSPPRQRPENDPRRQSYPQVPRECYPPRHDQIPPTHHPNVSQVNIPYPPPTEPQHFPYRYHGSSSTDQYEPSAPPPPADHAQLPQEARGAPPPTTQQQRAYIDHKLQSYFQSFYG